MNGSDEEIPDEEDAAEFYRAQRIHVDALLDISEEAFLKEVEPYEYHCYPGWEEAVCGWDRVAPISGILLPQKRDKKPKQRKETDNPAPLHIVEPTTSCGDTLASGGEHCSESHSTPQNLKKPTPSSQRVQPESPEWLAPDGVDEDMSHLLHEEKAPLSGIPLQLQHLPQTTSKSSRSSKSSKRHQTKSTVVPITNFTFLPPIK
ncbi:uncharacterized protein LOC133634023 isoform X1 [Entelurus aequoreus]|uniref:uncharacterized protein LOC133634023 isoform X1 n=1 Tax=Entelurus aequoreus TaxID=161455 RepID=UPI002B1E4667|nr:uncharacterized protein LOC133634023 isoform X1 [Entelurus aequoreus]